MKFKPNKNMFFVLFVLFALCVTMIYYQYNIHIENMNDNSLGFIITRHVKCENSNKIWIKCVQQIRKFYPDIKIVIIDDNSTYEFIKYDESLLDNCLVINSEYKGSGELLPYYYLYNNKWFDKAIFIHDSVFINNAINTDDVVDVKFLWHFNGGEHEDSGRIEELLGYLTYNNELIDFCKTKEKWKGCWGAMSVITVDHLTYIADKYNLFNLLQYINSRPDRMNFERIFGILCCFEDYNIENPSIFGYYGDNQNNRNSGSYDYNTYLEDEKNNSITTDISKLFFGR